MILLIIELASELWLPLESNEFFQTLQMVLILQTNKDAKFLNPPDALQFTKTLSS